MFSGRFELKKDSDGRCFIDRDGTHFKYILNYLIDFGSKDVLLPNDPFVLEEIKREFKYYQIPWPFSLIGDLSEQEWKEVVNWTNYKGTWDLVYKATRDGFQASEFHHHCNNKGPTLTFIEATNGDIFGGFSVEPWKATIGGSNSFGGNSNLGFQGGNNHSFIFSIDSKEEKQLNCQMNMVDSFMIMLLMVHVLEMGTT
jgi:hypothetical protein